MGKAIKRQLKKQTETYHKKEERWDDAICTAERPPSQYHHIEDNYWNV